MSFCVNAQEAAICKKRLKKEYTGIIANPLPNIQVSLDGDIENDPAGTVHLNWYCMLQNLGDDYAGGEYIFHIQLSGRYPFEPPDFYFLTPNGRFKCKTKLCFSNSSHHKGAALKPPNYL